MIVVSNTSPLNYLILIEEIEVLPEIFGRIVVPPSVAAELAHTGASRAVQSWIAAPPAWLSVQAPAAPDPSIHLHPGEMDMLSLGIELGADLVLVDDRAARRIASERGLPAIGTLGVLRLAADRGSLDLPRAVHALCGTGFRIRDDVLKRLLDEHEGRPKIPEE